MSQLLEAFQALFIKEKDVYCFFSIFTIFSSRQPLAVSTMQYEAVVRDEKDCPSDFKLLSVFLKCKAVLFKIFRISERTNCGSFYQILFVFRDDEELAGTGREFFSFFTNLSSHQPVAVFIVQHEDIVGNEKDGLLVIFGFFLDSFLIQEEGLFFGAFFLF